MLEAAFWGFVGGFALLVGTLIVLGPRIPTRVIALVMAFGTGVLISASAFELTEEAYDQAGGGAVALGLTLGALTFFVGDRLVEGGGGGDRKRSGDQEEGGNATAILLGSLLDGIPESAAIGISLLGGGGVGIPVVAAVFLSNVPESLSAVAGMRRAGRSTAYILGLWTAVALVSALAAALGYALLGGASPGLVACIQTFAAGAILAMLASTMMPEAFEEGGSVVGVVTALGFAATFLLSELE